MHGIEGREPHPANPAQDGAAAVVMVQTRKQSSIGQPSVAGFYLALQILFSYLVSLNNPR